MRRVLLIATVVLHAGLLPSCGGPADGGAGTATETLIGERRIEMREAFPVPLGVVIVDLQVAGDYGPFGPAGLAEGNDGTVLEPFPGEQYDKTVARLTDGVEHDVRFIVSPLVPTHAGGVRSVGGVERLFFPLQLLGGDVDFAAYRITDIEIEVEHVDFVTPGTDPAGTDVDLAVVVRVFGVPR